MGLIFSWSFTVVDYVSPWIDNTSPGTAAGLDAVVHLDILDDASGVDTSSLNAYINSTHVFSGPSTFIAPFNGAQSAISATNVDGYDGYHLQIDYVSNYNSDSSYTVRVTGQDAYGNAFDESFIFTTARIASLVNVSLGLYEITLDLTFDTPMLQDSNLNNSANYHFNKGMYARKVDVLTDDKVRLWVELFYGRDEGGNPREFTLTVDPAVKNIDGYSLLPTADSYDIIPFDSDATFANTNALVRTWHESTIIYGDSQRIYLAGTKGIDVFRKDSIRFSRWAQIFDEYGIDAMCVVNYPSDFVITDTVAPTLEDIIPPPSSFASPDTHILFKVRDTTTAVEITSLRIYIEGLLAFSGGYGGWQNGWGGSIDVEHHQLIVDIYKNTNFTPGNIITVRVIAQDLLGNELDITYNFSIAILVDGFGGTPWGHSPFGGV